MILVRCIEYIGSSDELYLAHVAPARIEVRPKMVRILIDQTQCPTQPWIITPLHSRPVVCGDCWPTRLVVIPSQENISVYSIKFAIKHPSWAISDQVRQGQFYRSSRDSSPGHRRSPNSAHNPWLVIERNRSEVPI